MLSARRDVSAAKRFFKKMMRADHRRLPFTIGTDKHASYPEAFAASVKEKVLPADCKLRLVKYLNNIIEQITELSEGGGERCNVSAPSILPS
jgi:transposase-like protein